ncbi:hypothetical protein BGZ58_010972 [Dissophora ornata]|nr:hypothetical protein BGZ58_010972 [Dissophora ornata]
MKAVHHGPVDSMFANRAWEEMLRTYGLPDYRPSTLSLFKGVAPMIKFTISDIESRQELHRGKVSNLVVMIKEVVMSEIDAAVTLLDPSGEMRGTVHRTVLERYKNNEIRVGTVLALENVSVFSPTPVSHYLIITIRNILRIFQPLPPTIVLSPGSSQDRLSQKKRKFVINSQDSQDSEKSFQNQTQEIASVGSSSTKPTKHHGQLGIDSSPTSDDFPPILITDSPDWEDAKPTTAANSSSASFEMQNMGLLNGISQDSQQRSVRSAPASQYSVHASPMSPQMSNKKPKQESSNRGSQSKTSTGSTTQETSYMREVQFQSLRQTLGGPSTVSVQDVQTQLATPMITLGSPTPGSSSISGSSGLLSSFAAPSNLRKRSSPTTLSQKSSSSESASGSRMARTPPYTVSHAPRPIVVAPSSSPIELSSSPASIEIQRSHSLHRLNSSDWPDDFEGIDFEEALEEDLSTTSISELHTIDQPKHSSVTVVSGTGPLSKSTPPFASWQTADDDDDDERALDNLLDGLDEAELFDL